MRGFPFEGDREIYYVLQSTKKIYERLLWVVPLAPELFTFYLLERVDTCLMGRIERILVRVSWCRI